MESLLLPRILLTNDDGIDAPGLAVLAEIVAPLTKELWLVAPKEDQSGASQKISLRQPLQVEKRDTHRFAVTGTPSDCVSMAINHLMGKKKPTLVISGVNATSNIGDEVSLSGTVGAALTSLMHGIPSIAISQAAAERNNIPWETTRAILPHLLSRFLQEGWRKETSLSINIPDLPPEKITGYRWVRQGQKNVSAIKVDERINPRGETYYWLSLGRKSCQKQDDNEHAALAEGNVAVVALSLDRSVAIDQPAVRFDDSPASYDDSIDI